MKKTKFIKFFEWIIYIGLVVGSMAYLWNIFTLFEAKDTSIKVKEIEINKQPIIVICTNEDNGNFGRHIDEMENIQLNYSSYTIWEMILIRMKKFQIQLQIIKLSNLRQLFQVLVLIIKISVSIVVKIIHK